MPNNDEFISSRNRKFIVSPNSVRLEAGDTQLIQVISDLDDYEVTVYPEGIVTYDREYNEISALSEGIATISFQGGDALNRQTQNVICLVTQPEEQTNRKVKIMLHSRITNRLTTIEGNLNEDLVIQLPGDNGKLATTGFVAKELSPIKKPYFMNVKEHNQFFIHEELEGSPFELIDSVDNRVTNQYASPKYLHTGTIWQFAADKDFKKIITEKYHRTGDLRKCGHERFGLSMWVRFRYVSREEFKSDWSDPVRITTGIDLGVYPEDRRKTWRDHDGKDVELKPIESGRKPDAWNGALLQFYHRNNHFFRRIYFGPWSLKRQHSSNQYRYGDVVWHNNKLWMSRVEQVGDFEPGVDKAKWEEYNWYSLPNAKQIYEHIGIAWPCNDNHPTGYTMGSPNPVQLADQDIHLIGYIYRGKVCYTYTNRIGYNVSHVDCAISHIKKSDRTIKIHEKTYYIRLMKEEEHRNILLPLAKDPRNQIYLYDKELLETLEDSPTARVGNADGTYEDIDAKLRTGCNLRLVFELIPEGSEPFKHWLYSQQGYCYGDYTDTNLINSHVYAHENVEDIKEQFYYDPLTDTGTFGLIKQYGYSLEWTDDFKQNPINNMSYETAYYSSDYDFGYFYRHENPVVKFYWHGQIVYIPTGDGIKNISPHYIINNTRKGIWPFSIGSSRDVNFHAKVKSYDKDKTKYYQGVIQGMRWPIATWWNNGDMKDQKYLGTDSIFTDLYTRIFQGQLWKYAGTCCSWTSTVGHHGGANQFNLLDKNYMTIDDARIVTLCMNIHGNQSVNNRHNVYIRGARKDHGHHTNQYWAGNYNQLYDNSMLMLMWIAKESTAQPTNEYGYISTMTPDNKLRV